MFLQNLFLSFNEHFENTYFRKYFHFQLMFLLKTRTILKEFMQLFLSFHIYGLACLTKAVASQIKRNKPD